MIMYTWYVKNDKYTEQIEGLKFCSIPREMSSRLFGNLSKIFFATPDWDIAVQTKSSIGGWKKKMRRRRGSLMAIERGQEMIYNLRSHLCVCVYA